MALDLFSHENESTVIELPDAELIYYPLFLSVQEADFCYQQLLDQAAWQQEVIMMYGKEIKVPRLSAWYADDGQSYVYSGIRHDALKMSPPLTDIKNRIEKLCGEHFNSVLLNLYRDQNDSVAWHSDDEPELGKQPVIASVSLGEQREFQLRYKKDKKQKYTLSLPHGSLLIMRGATQHFWEHQVAKSRRAMQPRINLTYRNIHS